MEKEALFLSLLLVFVILVMGISGCIQEQNSSQISNLQKDLNCKENEIYLNKTGDCYNSNDKIYTYERGEITLTCSFPCPLSDSEFLIEEGKIRDSYDFIYDLAKIEPRLETEVRIESDPLCYNKNVFSERVTKSGNKINVLCLPFSKDGGIGIPKELIIHELVHSFLEGKINCIILEEGLAKYITEVINPEEVVYGSKGLYESYKKGFVNISEILTNNYLKGFFFFSELNEKEGFQKDSIRLLFNKLENANFVYCETIRKYISEIKNPDTIEALTQKYQVYNFYTD